MAINVKRARRALRNAGLQSSARLGLAWPLGRQKRVTTLLRERREVLEAKNHVVEFLFRTQRGLADLRLSRVEHAHTALQDPQKRRIIMTVGASQVMLAEELSARYGLETGRSLERALAELVSEGVVLQVPAKAALANHDIYLAVHSRRRPHYDVGELNRLLRDGRDYGAELRSRSRREETTGDARTYDM
jgi:hypothetical protein